MIPKGTFLTIEGPDGLGKTSLSGKLSHYFRQLGHHVHITKEPGDGATGSILGEGIRNLLFKYPKATNMAPNVADLLFLADHTQHIAELSRFKDSGYTIISDRYADSQFAYMTAGFPRSQWLIDLYEAQYGPSPDIIIYLRGSDIDSGWPLKRANARKGIEEDKQDGKPWNNIEEQKKIQEAYDKRFDGNKPVLWVNVLEVDTQDDVFHKVIAGLEEWFR